MNQTTLKQLVAKNVNMLKHVYCSLTVSSGGARHCTREGRIIGYLQNPLLQINVVIALLEGQGNSPFFGLAFFGPGDEGVFSFE
jgi:hypothetical protein